jgi:hypothetical protein
VRNLVERLGSYELWDGRDCDVWIERPTRLLGGLFTKRKAARS